MRGFAQKPPNKGISNLLKWQQKDKLKYFLRGFPNIEPIVPKFWNRGITQINFKELFIR